MIGIVSSMLVGLAIRLGLLVYGLWQDSTMAVKYTDIDYYVFTDAAQYISKGDSPYKRATYRYTPLLAWILQPNVWWSPVCGKILFILCDVIAGYLIYSIIRRNHNLNMAQICALLWLLNPLPIVVSSRGNAESVIVVLVLMSVYVFTGPKTAWNITMCSVFYGLSVHMKIYPITYVMPMYLSLVNTDNPLNAGRRLKQLIGCKVLPNWRSLLFLLVTGSVILTLTYSCFRWCGFQFIQETYLYHVTRRDTRHNFSPYFYMLYLAGESQLSTVLALAAFIPQIVLLLIISFSFYEDLPFCCFLHTFIFVSFNKVCTSQYFLWYLCFLPLIIPRLYISLKEASFLILLWFSGQGIWLLPAYYLEFKGLNTFMLIWLAGLCFLLMNVWILQRIIVNYQPITQTGLLKSKEKCN